MHHRHRLTVRFGRVAPGVGHLLRPRSPIFSIALLLAGISTHAFADQVVEVTAHTLNVRAAPSISAPIVGHVKKHDQLVIKPVSENWAEVLHGAAIDGFVSTKYVRTLGVSLRM